MELLIDIGINLTSERFLKDRKEVIERAVKNGVKPIILTGTSLWASQESYQIAKEYPGILYTTAGIHPHDAKHHNQHTISKLRKLAEHKEVVAIGECGLDFNRNKSPQHKQENCFEEQLELARETGLPLFLHERDAHQRFVEMMKHHQDLIEKSVVHCFTGNEEEVKEYISMGFNIGITGWICDEKRGKDLQKAVKHIPLDRLMVETDAPYLIPKDMNNKPRTGRNEPMFLPHIVHSIAKHMNVSTEEVARYSTQNAKRFFNLD